MSAICFARGKMGTALPKRKSCANLANKSSVIWGMSDKGGRMPGRKKERWHPTLKNRILLENYYLPGDLEAQIEAFDDGTPMLGPRHRLGAGEIDQPAEAVLGVTHRQGLHPIPRVCSWPVVTNMAEYATVGGIAGCS
jgi:hypothetical protein